MRRHAQRIRGLINRVPFSGSDVRTNARSSKLVEDAAWLGFVFSLPVPAGLAQGPAQQEIDLRVQAAELVVGPALELVVDLRIQPQQE